MSSWPGARRTNVYHGLSNISLDSYLHKKVLLLLRDGRSFMGILRSFDHHSNAVLQGAFERVVVGHLYCDIPLGVFVVRGDEVILTGELGMEEERLSLQLMTRVSMAEIKRARKDEREAEDLKRKIGLGVLALD